MRKSCDQVFVQDCAGLIKVLCAICKPGMDQDSLNQKSSLLSALNYSTIYCDNMIYKSFQMVCSLALPKYSVEVVVPRAKFRHGGLSSCWVKETPFPKRLLLFILPETAMLLCQAQKEPRASAFLCSCLQPLLSYQQLSA